MASTPKERFELLKAMNTIVRLMNDEDAYSSWIYIIPDQADDDELQECAEDDGILRDAAHKFTSIIKMYGKHGYCADKKLYQ